MPTDSREAKRERNRYFQSDPDSVTYHRDEFVNMWPVFEQANAAFYGKTWWYINHELSSSDPTDYHLARILLPIRQGEKFSSWQQRLSYSVFEEYYSKAVRGYSGLLNDYEIKEDTLSWMEEERKKRFLANVDGKGNGLRAFLDDTDKKALNQGMTCLFVDYEQGPTEIDENGNEVIKLLTRAEAKTSAPLPRWVRYDREHLINWDINEEAINEPYRVDLLVFKTQLMKSVGLYGQKLMTRYTEMRKTPGFPVEIIKHDYDGVGGHGGTDPRSVSDPIVTDWVEIPVLFYPLQTFNPKAAPPMFGLAMMNFWHYRVHSLKQTYLRKLPPGIHRKGELKQGGDTSGLKPISMSSDDIIDTTADVDVDPFEFSGSGIAAYTEELRSIEEKMAAMTLDFLGDKKIKSATEAQLRAMHAESELQRFAIGKENSVKALFDQMAINEGVDPSSLDQGIKINTNAIAKVSLDTAVFFNEMHSEGKIALETLLDIIAESNILPSGINIEEVKEQLDQNLPPISEGEF